MSSNKKIQIIEPGKTVIFISPLSGYDNYLVRTGVLNENNNSFLHSILTAYSKDYFYMDTKNKKKFFEKFKENIFTISQYEKCSKNYIAYQSKVLETLNYAYNKNEITDKKIKKIIKNISKNPIYELLPDILPFDIVNNINIFNTKKDGKDNLFVLYKDSINEEIKFYLNSLEILNHVKDKNKVEFIKKNIKIIINTILEETKNYEYNNYYNEVTNDVNVNIDLINTLIKNLKLDIYFVDYKNKLPFKYDKDQIYKNKKSILVLKIEDNYEIIGLLLSDNKVQREFSSTHFLIEKSKTFLFEPEKIVLKCPELLQYTEPPKTFQNKKHAMNDDGEVNDDDDDGEEDDDEEDDEEEDDNKNIKLENRDECNNNDDEDSYKDSDDDDDNGINNNLDDDVDSIKDDNDNDDDVKNIIQK